MNRKIGLYSSLITLISVILFALFMIFNLSLAAYSVCIFLACGYVTMVSAYASYTTEEFSSAKYASIGFFIIYAIFVMLVYYAQITTVVQNNLSEEMIRMLDYQKFGLFFNYDLFGYGMLSVSTLFLGLTIFPNGREDKILRNLLLLHGVFSLVCFILIMGIFNTTIKGAEIIGVLVL